jgi:hypothetical protein
VVWALLIFKVKLKRKTVITDKLIIFNINMVFKYESIAIEGRIRKRDLDPAF